MSLVHADEFLARNGTKSVEDFGLADPPAPKLPLDHRLALCRIVCHGHDHGPTSAS
jgi:hypothetical protein